MLRPEARIDYQQYIHLRGLPSQGEKGERVYSNSRLRDFEASEPTSSLAKEKILGKERAQGRALIVQRSVAIKIAPAKYWMEGMLTQSSQVLSPRNI